MTDALEGPSWLTIREAAAHCGVSPDTVRRAIRAGRFPRAARLPGGDRGWRVSVADLAKAGYLDPGPTTPPNCRPAPAPNATRLGNRLPNDLGRPSPDAAQLARVVRELREENTALRAENARLRDHTLALLDRLAAVVGGDRR